MPRKSRDERLDTRTARLKLTPRREPYWRNIQEGRAIGYRRVASGKAGHWVARWYEAAEGRKYQAFGAADDMLDADGTDTLSFSQAQDRARTWFAEVQRSGGRVVEPVTVRDAMTAYETDYLARGGKALSDLRATVAAHILPALGDKLVNDLAFPVIRAWHHKLAAAPARLRTKAKAKTQRVRKIAADDANAHRARRASANRVLTVLKAALSLAYREGQAASDDAWRRVKPFPNVDAARVRYLADDESRRLVNACPADLRRLVTAALVTGCRYGELTKLRTADFDAAGRVLHIREAKGGKPRAVPLTDDAVRFFTTETAGKVRGALVLTREDGDAWGRAHQFRPLRDACTAAQIAPAVSFHILRHSFASRLVMKRVPLSVVAAALGNTEAICAKHYAHLAPGYIADTIREHGGGLGIVPDSNVSALRAG
jgi:site-specific recombinase XerD